MDGLIVGRPFVDTVLLLALGGCSSAPIGQFCGRDGEAEATKAALSNAQLIVYIRTTAGAAISTDAPGLDYCSPDYVSLNPSLGVFSPMEEANFVSGQEDAQAENIRAWSALSFAKAYNVTTYRLRRSELTQLCPRVAPARGYSGTVPEQMTC